MRRVIDSVLLLTFLFPSCTEVPLLDEMYTCIPNTPFSCPSGMSCLYNAHDERHYCYKKTSHYCGNDVLDPGEECDGEDFGDATCADFGHQYGGTLSCDENCTVTLTGCDGFCGDGIRQAAEECDQDDFVDGQCVLGGMPACTDQCRLDPQGCTNFLSIAPSTGSSTCGVTEEGTLYCWGSIPDAADVSLPTLFSAASFFVKVSTSSSHSCALDAQGQAYCWGTNWIGELGTGDLVHYPEPHPVAQGNLRFADIAAGYTHSCALTVEGAAYCWGNNANGQLGTGVFGSSEQLPAMVAGGHSFVNLVAGTYHNCALTALGEAYCWGEGEEGQLGINSSISQPTPQPVAGGHLLRQISAKGRHTCAITLDREAMCWGDNQWGQLGINTFFSTYVPTPVFGTRMYEWIAAGENSSCALTLEGQAWCWGDNQKGMLGDGTTVWSHKPIEVEQGETIFRSIEVGSMHVCALSDRNMPYCWGWNISGEVGDGTFEQREMPTPVILWMGE